MKVYVLFHADIEDDRYVRGVYARHEDAEADVVKVEDRGYEKQHDKWCCGVDEVEVLEQPVGLDPLYGPPVPPEGGYIIADTLAGALQEMALRSFPAFDRLAHEPSRSIRLQYAKIAATTEDEP